MITVVESDGHGASIFSGPDTLMYLETLSPLIAMIVFALVIGWVATTWLRIKNGYPLHDSWGRAVHPKKQDDRAQQLTQENAQLRAELGSVKDRLANVERIVTDSGYNVSAQIEALRDTRRVEDEGDGVPLALNRKERA